MCVKISVSGIFILNFVITAHCALKVFRYDADIFNPQNWVDGKQQEHCDGLIFPQETYSRFLIEEIDVDSMVLSEKKGEIVFTKDATINFNSTSILNCVELKALPFHLWDMPSSWYTVGKEENHAIPHKERAPCEYDDVVFPHGDRSGIIVQLVPDLIKVKSFKFGNDSWTNEDLATQDKPLRDNFVFGLEDFFKITNKGCDDESGCVCGNFDRDGMHCDPSEEKFRCTAPVEPIGFCHPICGASVLVEPTKSFRIAEMEKRLERYSSQTYVSKVRDYDSGYDFVQIIFTEKKFQGNSLDEAHDLYEQIKQEFPLGHVTLLASGPYNNEEEFINNAVSIVFGTLCGVVLVFFILFFVYSPNGTAIILRNRLNMRSRHLPSFKTAYFTRHSSVAEDAALVFEGQSLASSLLSIDKSFENPMYGKDEKSIPSTSSLSNVTGNLDAGAASTSINRSEFEIEKSISDTGHKQFDDDISEGELVDLSNM